MDEPSILFESYNLLWTRASGKVQWRRPAAADWELLLGLPLGWTSPLGSDDTRLRLLSSTPPPAPLQQPFQAWFLHQPAVECPRAGGLGERLGPLRPAFEQAAHLFASPRHPVNRFSLQ